MMRNPFREVCTDLLRGLDELQDPRYPFPGYTTAAMDRARELLAQPAPAAPARLRHCPTHGQQPPEAWGCPECLRELREELAALRTLPADGPSIEQLGPLISWLLEQCDQVANAGRSTDAGMLLWAAQVVGERVDEDAPDANLPAEGAAWQAAATLRRLAAQNPMGVTDPAIISAAELIERLAGKLVMLRQEHPHG